MMLENNTVKYVGVHPLLQRFWDPVAHFLGVEYSDSIYDTFWYRTTVGIVLMTKTTKNVAPGKGKLIRGWYHAYGLSAPHHVV